MKRFFLFALLTLIFSRVEAQSTDFFKYQAVIRNSAGLPVKNQIVGIRITILQGAVDGTSVYSEQHESATSDYGAVSLNVGAGENLTGDFNIIDWASNSHFLKVEVDYDNSGNFVDAGTSQLLSVPYALFSKRSGDQKWLSNGSNLHFSEGNVGIGTDSPQEALHINGSIRGGEQGGALRVKTEFGHMDIGPKNADYAHFYTAMPYGFAFGNTVTVAGQLIGYRSGDLHLSTQSNTTYQPEKRITILNSNGYVGVGKTNPEYSLDVNGTINASSILINGAPIASSDDSAVWSVSGNNAYYNKGFVGIGTDSPQEALHINGSIRGGELGGALRVKTDYGYMDIGAKNADYAHFFTPMPYGFAFGNNVTVSGQLIGYRSGDFHISTQSNSTYQPEKRITILNSNGYVGVGKTDPAYNLDVNGTINASSILINGSPIGTGDGSSVWSLNGSNAYYSDGNVGIGTDAPLEALHVNGSIRGGELGGALRVETDYGYMDIGPKNADYAHFYTAMPYGFAFGANVTVSGQVIGYRSGDLHLSTQSNTTYQPVKRMTILNSNGNVGIGTEQPKAKVQVESGDIYLKDSNSGVIMRSPNQQCWKLTVTDSGTPTFVSVTCPE